MTTVTSSIPIPARSRVVFKVEINAEFNISAFVARQKANRFLLMNVGDALHAGSPELVIGPELRWRVPVMFALPKHGELGQVGELWVDVDTGAVSLSRVNAIEEITDYAETLYRRATSSSGTTK